VETWLHYIGKYLYNKEQFEQEINKYGVSRSVSFRILPNFQFGSSVLLAYYNTKMKLADCIGYFVITGLSHNLQKDVLFNVNKKLHIVNWSTDTTHVKRRCGSYSIGLTLTVTNTLKEIIDAIRETCQDQNYNPEKFKYFLTGYYTAFPTPVILNSLKFFRGYKRLTFEVPNFPAFLQYIKQSYIPERTTVKWIYNYEKKRYVTKKYEEELKK